ncbi:hypothetical protein MLD38_009721 [Melastoma candidum]|uniref:Uncharacterized protein n=1 Tax=Melastoma candidum TaxID=119954 RepID=A0ACB9S2T5_9MYRT|nr:hypothetical protein MLD38_009721 [Melastoma candidum]
MREARPPPNTPEDAARLVIQTLKRHQKADVEGLLSFYGLLLPQDLVPLSAGVPASLPHGVLFELQTLPVDARAVADGDTITVYVSTSDPRESCSVPQDVHIAALESLAARAERKYSHADALHQTIINSGYRVLNLKNGEVLAKKYRIRLRGIDAPLSTMPYGKEAKEELVRIVEGKCVRVLVYGQDRYERSVGDVYCNHIFVQEAMLKKGLAWHGITPLSFFISAVGEGGARAKRIGLWASSNPEKPWEWRKDRREGEMNADMPKRMVTKVDINFSSGAKCQIEKSHAFYCICATTPANVKAMFSNNNVIRIL